MSEDFIDCVWLGEQAVIYGWNAEGASFRRDLTEDEMVRVIKLEAAQNAAMQHLLAELAAAEGVPA